MPPFPCIPIPLLFTLLEDTSIQPQSIFLGRCELMADTELPGVLAIWWLTPKTFVFSPARCRTEC